MPNKDLSELVKQGVVKRISQLPTPQPPRVRVSIPLKIKTVIILNILSLLRKEPKTWLQIWKSGSFYNPNMLKKGLKLCTKVGLIDFQKIDITMLLYTITEKGIMILSGFPWFEARRVRRNVQNIDGYALSRMMEQGYVVKVCKEGRIYRIPSAGVIISEKGKRIRKEKE